MGAVVVKGREIADKIKKDVKSKLDEFISRFNVTPTVASIVVGGNKESQLYLRLRDKACSEIGINSIHYSFPDKVSEEKVIETIDSLNNDRNIQGIFLQLPLPKHLSFCGLLSRIDYKKDVEGLTPHNLGSLMTGEENIIPCTPLAVLRILEHVNVKLEGANVVIVNHSPLVGKPLSMLLLNRNASVTVCHVYTSDLQFHTGKADVLITAAGVPGLVTTEHVKEDAVVIDVGITKTSDGVVGDVVFDEVKEKAGVVTPVPGGVGPVTVACSLENMVKTYLNCVTEDE